VQQAVQHELFDRTDDERVRQHWRDLVNRRLPEAAATRDWPVRYNHCFARIVLDVALGAPWRSIVKPPAWRNAPIADLRAAIALGEQVLAGNMDLHALNAQSLALRGRREDMIAPDAHARQRHRRY